MSEHWDHVVVTTTIDDAGRAGELAEGLVESGLAACVQRLPIESTYRWQGAVETAHEVLLQAKTRSACASEVMRFIRARHPYETPEIIVTPIVGGDPSYLDWISTQTAQRGGA